MLDTADCSGSQLGEGTTGNMGRRSQHSPDELRELILGAARRVIVELGFQELSAREIARVIGYAPGTLYNMFDNLDEILLRVEARILEELDEAVGRAMTGKKGAEAVRCFATTYVQFAYDNPQLWQLIQEHSPTDRGVAAEWYLERLYAPLARLEPELGRLIGSSDADDIARLARLIWSSIHGIIQVATTPKFGTLPLATTMSMIETLVTRYVSAQVALPAARSDARRVEGEGKRIRHAS